MLCESIYVRLFQDGTSQQRGDWVKICDLKSPCNALPQMWYESLLAARWTISISPRRDQDGAGLIRPSHRLDDKTGERILLGRGQVKVRHFYLFFLRSCATMWPPSTSPTSSKPGVCFGPDTLNPQPQHCTASLINGLSYLWNTFTGAGK